jgi:hypothetical protein
MHSAEVRLTALPRSNLTGSSRRVLPAGPSCRPCSRFQRSNQMLGRPRSTHGPANLLCQETGLQFQPQRNRVQDYYQKVSIAVGVVRLKTGCPLSMKRYRDPMAL